MQDEPIGLSPADDNDRADGAVLGLLLNPNLAAPVSTDEVVREIGERLSVLDALARLHGAGLIHRCGDFAFATQAARRFDELGV